MVLLRPINKSDLYHYCVQTIVNLHYLGESI